MQIKKWSPKDTVCLDVGITTTYKQKKSLIDLLTSSGCKISFILNKNVKFLIRDDRNNLNTYKCKTAIKWGIPILHTSYVFDSVKSSNLKMQHYLIENKKSDVDFTNGIISASQSQNKSKNLTFLELKLYKQFSDNNFFSNKIILWYLCVMTIFIEYTVFSGKRIINDTPRLKYPVNYNI